MYVIKYITLNLKLSVNASDFIGNNSTLDITMELKVNLLEGWAGIERKLTH